MISCTRKIEFDAAHRVMEHEHSCRFLHGHRYVIEATFTAEALDKLGRVIDFGQVREILGDWVHTHWDHTAILNLKDKALGQQLEHSTGQKVYYMEGNPTAEALAEYLLNKVCPKLFTNKGVRCTHIRLYETPNCWADAGV